MAKKKVESTRIKPLIRRAISLNGNKALATLPTLGTHAHTDAESESEIISLLSNFSYDVIYLSGDVSSEILAYLSKKYRYDSIICLYGQDMPKESRIVLKTSGYTIVTVNELATKLKTTNVPETIRDLYG